MPGEAYSSETGLAVFVFVGRMTVDPLVVLVLAVLVVSEADSEADSFSPNDVLAREDDTSWDNLPVLDKRDTVGTGHAPNTPALLETDPYSNFPYQLIMERQTNRLTHSGLTGVNIACLT